MYTRLTREGRAIRSTAVRFGGRALVIVLGLGAAVHGGKAAWPGIRAWLDEPPPTLPIPMMAKRTYGESSKPLSMASPQASRSPTPRWSVPSYTPHQTVDFGLPQTTFDSAPAWGTSPSTRHREVEFILPQTTISLGHAAHDNDQKPREHDHRAGDERDDPRVGQKGSQPTPPVSSPSSPGVGITSSSGGHSAPTTQPQPTKKPASSKQIEKKAAPEKKPPPPPSPTHAPAPPPHPIRRTPPPSHKK